MGLFILKTQVEALGGKINIESTVNEGTLFTLEFVLVTMAIEYPQSVVLFSIFSAL